MTTKILNRIEIMALRKLIQRGKLRIRGREITTIQELERELEKLKEEVKDDR